MGMFNLYMISEFMKQVLECFMLSLENFSVG